VAANFRQDKKRGGTQSAPPPREVLGTLPGPAETAARTVSVEGQAIDFYIAYLMTKSGLAGVIVAVPPRLEFTVTDVGATRTAGDWLVSLITLRT